MGYRSLPTGAGIAHVRSWSIFGLSTVEMVFAEETTNFENRERVLERPSQVTMPPGVAPQMSHGIGSDSQRPFAIVIVGGLIANLGMSIFLLPTMYVWIAGEKDVLPEPEADFET